MFLFFFFFFVDKLCEKLEENRKKFVFRDCEFHSAFHCIVRSQRKQLKKKYTYLVFKKAKKVDVVDLKILNQISDSMQAKKKDEDDDGVCIFTFSQTQNFLLVFNFIASVQGLEVSLECVVSHQNASKRCFLLFSCLKDVLRPATFQLKEINPQI